jgi:hypothetical protein
LTSPLPRGQLAWLKLSPIPVAGGVGVGWLGSVVTGVDDEGEPPPPQDNVRKAMTPTAETAAAGTKLRQTSIIQSFLKGYMKTT